MTDYSKEVRTVINEYDESGFRVTRCHVQCLGCRLYLLPLRNAATIEDSTMITARHPAPADVRDPEFNSLRDFYANCPNQGRIYKFNMKMEPVK